MLGGILGGGPQSPPLYVLGNLGSAASSTSIVRGRVNRSKRFYHFSTDDDKIMGIILDHKNFLLGALGEMGNSPKQMPG